MERGTRVDIMGGRSRVEGAGSGKEQWRERGLGRQMELGASQEQARNLV